MFLAIFNWFVKITGWIPQLIVMRNRIHYEDKKIQSRKIKGKAIVVSNLNSVMDFAVMMYVFRSRTLRCVVAEILYQKNVFFTLFLKMMGTICVNRKEQDFGFIEKSAAILEKGGVVEIYPEARLPKKDEERPLPFTPSTVYFALRTGAPIIPGYNTRSGLSTKTCDVIIGKPIYLRELYDESLSEKQNIDNLNQFLRGRIIELGKQLQGNESQKETVRL